MRLVFAGTPEPAVVALQRLLDSTHEVVAVITRPDARKGRGRSLHPSPVAQLAERYDIPVLKLASLKADTEDGAVFRQQLQQLQPDCIPVVAYGNLITEDLLEAAPHGWVNLHFSLLPRWRGAAPVQAAIAGGDTMTGAFTFQIESGLDTGPVFGTVDEKIQPTDTADDLLTRLAYSGAGLLEVTMDGLAAGTLVPTPQVGEPSYAAKITKEDARIDWTGPAEVIDHRVRAYTPAPGAWTMMGEQRVKLGPLTLAPEAEALEPGVLRVDKQGVFVGTGSHPLRVGMVQVPGKKMMRAADWARGAQLNEGVVWQ